MVWTHFFASLSFLLVLCSVFFFCNADVEVNPIAFPGTGRLAYVDM